MELSDFLLDLLKVIIPAGIAIFAALVGWRWQIVGKRRFELAEQLLLQFNHAADVLQNARIPMSRANEGSTRGRDEHDPDEITRLKDSYWVPAERVNANIEVLAEARKNELIARYYFGPDAEKSFRAIKESADSVFEASRMLIMTVRHDGRPPVDQAALDRQHRWERDIWGTFNNEDRIHVAISEARSKLEKVLTPELRNSARWWPIKIPGRS